MKRYSGLIICKKKSILDVLKRMNDQQTKLLIIVEDNKFYSLISIGDIQRAILAKVSLEQSIEKILRKDVTVATEKDSEDSVKKVMIKNRLEFMPVICEETKEIKKIIFWKDVVNGDDDETAKETLDCPVVVMAGGRGSRLKPLTNIIPKPLIPVNNKAILHEIFDRFHAVGVKEFLVSVNYKANMIREYFSEFSENGYTMTLFEENKPTGTIGSLSLMKERLGGKTFFVSNCDILIEEDYQGIYDFHKEYGNELTIVAAVKHYSIPYGVINTVEGGMLESIEEKPEMVFQVNTGMYVFEPHLLQDIPEDTFFDITKLIEKIRARGGKIGVFPVSGNSWYDIGEWQEYRRTLFQHNH